MSRTRVTELPVVGCIPFRSGTASFALPLLAHPTDRNVRLVQELDEVRDVVCDFQILDGYNASNSVLLQGPLSKIDKKFVHVFIDENGHIHSGRVDDLRPAFQSFMFRCPDNHAIILQMIELMGTDQEKGIARKRMRSSISHSAGLSAASAFYEGAALRSALWQHLLNSTTSPETARKILRARSRLSAYFNSDGTISLDLSALDPKDVAQIDQASIVARLSAEFDSALSLELPLHADIKPGNILQTGRVSDLLSKINRTGRQEDRISILVDAILQERDVGISALVQYPQDKSKFANWALRELRANFLEPKGRAISDDELVVANLIPRFFTNYYPLNRGQLLLSLAVHLGKWPKVNRAIQNSLNKTRSIFVEQNREEIGRILHQQAMRE